MHDHLIHRIRFDLQAGQAHDAEALQERLSRFSHARLTQVLERCLAQYDRDGPPLQYDDLEIDLGVLDPSAPDDQIAERIEQRLREPLARAASRRDESANVAFPCERSAGTRGATVVPEDASCRVANAGLVLLWPYLAHYFDALGMLHGPAFLSAGDRARAPYLLQLLASGEMAEPEAGILLNKILCGVDAVEALPAPEPAREAEATLAAQLLYAVTQNWSKLENTSIPVLRSTFVMRDGLLTRRGGDWVLAVAPGPFDPLLYSLPWSLSAVRLPWMQELLFVEWKR